MRFYAISVRVVFGFPPYSVLSMCSASLVLPRGTILSLNRNLYCRCHQPQFHNFSHMSDKVSIIVLKSTVFAHSDKYFLKVNTLLICIRVIHPNSFVLAKYFLSFLSCFLKINSVNHTFMILPKWRTKGPFYFLSPWFLLNYKYFLKVIIAYKTYSFNKFVFLLFCCFFTVNQNLIILLRLGTKRLHLTFSQWILLNDKYSRSSKFQSSTSGKEVTEQFFNYQRQSQILSLLW